MKIGIYTDSYYYPVKGGVNRVTYELITRLARLDTHNQYILFNTFGHRDASAFGIDQPNFRTVAIPGHRKIRLANWMFRSAPVVERWTGHLDVCHTPCHVVPPSVAPLITTIHDLYVITQPTSLFSLNLIVGARIAFKAAVRGAAITCVSDGTRDEVVELLRPDPRKVLTIRNGVSTEFTPDAILSEGEAIRNKYGISRGYFLYISVIRPSKNHARLIRAYEIFRSANPSDKTQLVLAGQKDINPEFDEALEKSPHKSDIIVTGYIPDEDLPPLLRTATALVFPSLMEGFGLPVAEAMACGTPVAVSDLPAIREYAADAVTYFNPGDEWSIAKAMARIASDTALREHHRDAGLARAAALSWDRMARDYVGLYEKVGSGKF